MIGSRLRSMPPRDEGKDDGEGKDAYEDEAKPKHFEDNELLMYVAVDADKHLFGKESELTRFMDANSEEFQDSLDGDRSGAGTPIKAMGKLQNIHREYNEIMEEILEAIVKKNGGTIDRFLRDVKDALDGGEGFLFEDDNYAEFVKRIQAMDDYSTFHRLMVECAAKNASLHK